MVSWAHADRAGQPHRVPFLFGADIEQAQALALLQAPGRLGRGDLQAQVLLMAPVDVLQDLLGIQVSVAGAELGQGLPGIEGAGLAAPYVVLAEEGSAGPGPAGQHLLHWRHRVRAGSSPVCHEHAGRSRMPAGDPS